MLTVSEGFECAPGDVGGSAISGNLMLGGPTSLVNVQSNALLVISAVVASAPGNVEFRKEGLGELRLAGSRIYTALTRIRAGTVRVTASGGLGQGDVRLEGGKLVLVNAAIDSGKSLIASEPAMLAVEGQTSS